jgi:hypothetical protein
MAPVILYQRGGSKHVRGTTMDEEKVRKLRKGLLSAFGFVLLRCISDLYNATQTTDPSNWILFDMFIVWAFVEFFDATEGSDERSPGFSWAKVVRSWPSLAGVVTTLACVVALGWQIWQHYRPSVDPLILGALFLLTMAFVGYRIFKA